MRRIQENKKKEIIVKDILEQSYPINLPKQIKNPIALEMLKGAPSIDVAFAKVILKNPSIFCKYILNFPILPFQHIILKKMFTKPFMIMVCCRGFGKSQLYAIYAIMKSIIDQGSRIIIVGSGFRQSKEVFDRMELIYNNAPLFRELCGYNNAQVFRHNSDQFSMRIGSSVVKAIPLTDNTIRGLRANTILVDEVASVAEETLNVVIRGFAAVPLNPYENVMYHYKKEKGIEAFDTSKPNQFIVAGTADYQFNHFYKLYSNYKKIIEKKLTKGSEELEDYPIEDINYKKYCIIQVPFHALPKGYMEEDMIANAMATMSKEQFDKEYNAIFPGGLDGFFPMKDIEKCTAGAKWKDFNNEINIVPIYDVELEGANNAIYVMGVDPARSGDNFAVAVFKIEGLQYKLVYLDSWSKTSWDKSTFELKNIINRFNPKRIGVDNLGGGQTIKDNLASDLYLRPNEKKIWTWNEPEEEKYEGLHLLEMVQFSNATWYSAAHFSLQHDLYHRRIAFPYGTSSRTLTNNRQESLKEVILDEIFKAKIEMNSIVQTQTATGKNHFDVPELRDKTLKSKMRKDRFSAILIGAYIARSFIGVNPVSQMPVKAPPGDTVRNLVGPPVKPDETTEIMGFNVYGGQSDWFEGNVFTKGG